MKTQILTHIDSIGSAEWNALAGSTQPFLRHEFLAALEHQHCVGADSGWEPYHLLLRADDGRLLGALPLYRKQHSWGEFVFDFAWAQAYSRHGLNYYPKLVAAVPFTPASGPRFLVADDQTSTADLRTCLLDAALELARAENLSSLHVLFPEESQLSTLKGRGLLLRSDCQFHWHNRGYADFNGFLAEFTAEKRKKALRERRRVSEAGINFRTLSGGEIDAALWEQIYAFHADTFLRHGHTPYLNSGFFREIAKTMPQAIVVQLAEYQGKPVAAAICFRGDDTLYGRYWGASENFHSLHFEACYYQGIEYCIDNKLARFEPGTQGEHKISRGFVPAYTHSAHWISDERFRHGIDDYLKHERAAVVRYADDIRDHVPYKKNPDAFANPAGSPTGPAIDDSTIDDPVIDDKKSTTFVDGADSP